MYTSIFTMILSIFAAPFKLSTETFTAVAQSPLGIAELYYDKCDDGKFAVMLDFDGGDGNHESVLTKHALAYCDSEEAARAFMKNFIKVQNARTQRKFRKFRA